jgi:hypothetical protein
MEESSISRNGPQKLVDVAGTGKILEVNIDVPKTECGLTRVSRRHETNAPASVHKFEGELQLTCIRGSGINNSESGSSQNIIRQPKVHDI